MLRIIGFALFVSSMIINVRECINSFQTIQTIRKQFKRINMPGGGYPVDWLGLEYKTPLSFIFSSVYYLFTAILISVSDISLPAQVMVVFCVIAATGLISQWILQISYKKEIKLSFLIFDLGLYVLGLVYCVFSFVTLIAL